MRISKVFLYLLIIASLAVAGYYLAGKFNPFARKNGMELVSSDAIVVFETQNPVMAWNQLISQPLWSRLVDLPALNQAQNQLMALDSIFGSDGSLEKTLRGNQLIVSLHPVGREEFDFLYTFSFKNTSDLKFLEKLESQLPPLSQINSRSYSNVTIKEFQSLELERNLNYTVINNVLVVSYTSFLVEEAIRYSQSSNLSNFKSLHKKLFDELPSAKGLGVVRLSASGLANLVAGISRGKDLSMIRNFERTGVSANLELKFLDGKIFLDGNAYFPDGREMDFSNQESSSAGLFQNYISNRTAVYSQYNFKVPGQLTELEDEGFQYNSSLKGDIEKNLLERGFLENLSGALGNMLFEINPNEPQDQVLIIHSASVDQQIGLLKQFGLGVEETGSLDGLPLDFYQEREIFMVASEEFPAHLFEGKFMGFEDTYITSFGNLLIFANSSKAMKLFIDDLNNDNTWGRSLQQKRLIESISSNDGFTFIINVARFWNSVEAVSSPNWKAFFQKYAPQLKSIDLISMKVKELDKKNHVSIELGYNLEPIKQVQDIMLTENKSFQFDNTLVYGPISVQNFVDNSLEFVVQDENDVMHLLTSEGSLVFSYQLDGPVISEIFQVDYYKNGKLQLLLATENQVYIVDRLGNIVPSFPVSINAGRITHLNLVDYSNSKEYRFFIGTDEGNLLLLDKGGNLLDGWNPKKISSQLAIKPAHHRIAGVGDRMVALTVNGQLYFFNRRGESELGSPIRLGDGLTSDYIILERGSARDTRLVTITKEGEVVQVNFMGELTYRNQLMRPDRESKFYLIKDQKEDRYLFVVHEYNKVTVLDQEYKELFVINMFAENLDFQFFSFGSDKNIFVITDPYQEFIYLYNLQGNLLNTTPISGDQKIDLKYSGSQNEYTIYAVSGNRFSEYKLPL